MLVEYVAIGIKKVAWDLKMQKILSMVGFP